MHTILWDDAQFDAVKQLSEESLPLSTETLFKLVEEGKNYTSACAENVNPEYLAHLNSPAQARDIDFVRNLTGYFSINFFGYEYGSFVGTAYAGIFPSHVGKMALSCIAIEKETPLILAIDDYELFNGITGNALDFQFLSHQDLPQALINFAKECVIAAGIIPEACMFAQPSMNAADPVGDIVSRVYNVLEALSKVPALKYNDEDGNETVITFESATDALPSQLGNPSIWPRMARDYMDIENALAKSSAAITKRQLSTGSSLNYSTSFDENNPFSGDISVWLEIAISCAENSYEGISTDTDYVQYLSSQIQQNSVLAYGGIWNSYCLNWPNLTAYDVEKVTESFGNLELQNKILFVGLTSSSSHSKGGQYNTYSFIGADNANMLTVDP